MCARDPSDRRRIEVSLTPEGSRALVRISADVSGTETGLLAPLAPEERELFASLLRRVHTHLELDRTVSGALPGVRPGGGSPQTPAVDCAAAAAR